jgi:hypothetical protein
MVFFGCVYGLLCARFCFSGPRIFMGGRFGVVSYSEALAAFLAVFYHGGGAGIAVGGGMVWGEGGV